MLALLALEIPRAVYPGGSDQPELRAGSRQRRTSPDCNAERGPTRPAERRQDCILPQNKGAKSGTAGPPERNPRRRQDEI